MVYYEDEKLIIRNMERLDAKVFMDEFTAQGWHPEIDGYLARLKDQSGKKKCCPDGCIRGVSCRLCICI